MYLKNLLVETDHTLDLGVGLGHGELHQVINVLPADDQLVLPEGGSQHGRQVAHTDEPVAIEVIYLERDCGVADWQKVGAS